MARRWKNLCCMLLMVLNMLWCAAQTAYSDEVISIEGVMTDLGDKPDEFYVLINQEIYGAGDHIGSYTVIAVDAKGVELKNNEKDERQYYLVGTKLGETKTPSTLNFEEDLEIQSDALQESEKTGLTEKMTSYLSDIKSTVQQLQYGAVVEDLKRIQIAAMERALMTGNSSSVSIAQLIADGALPPLFKDSQNHGYYFKILPLADGRVRTSAAPVEKEISKPYFLIDEHRYVYIEQGKPATQESPLFSGQSQIQVSPAV